LFRDDGSTPGSPPMRLRSKAPDQPKRTGYPCHFPISLTVSSLVYEHNIYWLRHRPKTNWPLHPGRCLVFETHAKWQEPREWCRNMPSAMASGHQPICSQGEAQKDSQKEVPTWFPLSLLSLSACLCCHRLSHLSGNPSEAHAIVVVHSQGTHKLHSR